MSSLQTNIQRGAIRVSDDLVIGGSHETCLLCNSTMSPTGCCNVGCLNFRDEPMVQIALRQLKAKYPTYLNKIFPSDHGQIISRD